VSSDSIDPVTRAAMQMGNCDNYESVTVKTVYHTVRESPQATTPHARFQFPDTNAEKQVRAERPGPTHPVILGLPRSLPVIPSDRVVEFILRRSKEDNFHCRRCLAITDS